MVALTALTALAAVIVCACGEPTPPPVAALAALPTKDASTRDGILTVPLPTDLVVTVQERSLFGTSADGSFRLFLEHRPGEKLPEVLGAMKDELIGLGWEPHEEQHFQTAVSVSTARGPKQARQQRTTWILESNGRVAVCEAIATETQAARLGPPLRKLCESVHLESPETQPL